MDRLAVAITVDAMGSRGSVTEIVRVAEALNEAGRWLVPFAQTIGDEIQAVAADGESVCVALDVLAREHCWIGFGIGRVDELQSESRLSGGEAFDRARQAVERSNQRQGRGRHPKDPFGIEATWPLAVVGESVDASMIEYAAALYWTLVNERTDRQQKFARLAQQGLFQREIAETEGIRASSVSKALSAAHYREATAARMLVRWLVDEELGK